MTSFDSDQRSVATAILAGPFSLISDVLQRLWLREHCSLSLDHYLPFMERDEIEFLNQLLRCHGPSSCCSKALGFAKTNKIANLIPR
jgi:hypothetical protein